MPDAGVGRAPAAVCWPGSAIAAGVGNVGSSLRIAPGRRLRWPARQCAGLRPVLPRRRREPGSTGLCCWSARESGHLANVAGKGSSPMKYVSVLTPPFLMCAVVVYAVVAFLRHEMRRGRADQAEQDGSISALPDQLAEEADNERGAET